MKNNKMVATIYIGLNQLNTESMMPFYSVGGTTDGVDCISLLLDTMHQTEPTLTVTGKDGI